MSISTNLYLRSTLAIMGGMKIRQANIEDLRTLYEFEQGIISAERPFDSTLDKDPISYYDLKELVLSSDAEVVVAILDNVIIASAYAQIRAAKDYLDHARYAHLGFMFVRPEQRGKGINGEIIVALEEWIRSKGVREIRLQVYAENDAALSAYNKKGFKAHMLTMRKRI